MLNAAFIARRRRLGGNPLAAYTLGGNTSSIALDFANGVYQQDGADVDAGAIITGDASAFSIAGATMPTFDNGIWIVMKGRITYADNNSAAEKYFFKWQQHGLTLFTASIRTDGGTGSVFVSHGDGVVYDSDNTGGVYAPGTDVPFSFAVRAKAPDLCVSADGIAGTPNETLVGHPDLSSFVFYGGADGTDTWTGAFDIVMIGTGSVTDDDLAWASDPATEFPNSGQIPATTVTFGGEAVTFNGEYVTYG